MNKFICTSAAFDAASYEGAEAIVIFLCKECVPGLGKIALPEAVYATAKAFWTARLMPAEPVNYRS